ncbi:MAG TPA: AAA family ATPase, partial [Thermomicrobiales bacterium]|nr:AAA family ATPase [Thermomicrobiales bacterium]
MILSTLELENYRQYRSERIEFPERGIVGVVGANGVGKTTLFEAIEWCLFAPRTIGNGDVPPRGIPGATKVTLTLFDPRDGLTWVVERGLTKSGLKTAAIYREDNPAAPVAQGTGPVTRYIENRLIGLSHQAFVSTFFTRQKELSFFGTLGASDRRREVSRLLGFDVIRAAQTAVADEGNARRGHADALALEVTRTLDERDFEREIVDARIEGGRLGGERDAALLALERSRTAQAAVDQERDRLQSLKSQDGDLRVRLERANGELRLAEQRRQTAEAALVDLARKANERQGLVPLADGELAARQTVERFDADRQRAEARARMQQDVARQRQEIDRSAVGLRGAVANVETGRRIPGWVWTDADAADPAAGAARLETVIAGLDVHAAARRSMTLARCRKAADDVENERKRLDRFETKLAEYARQRDELFRDGDPAAQAADARATGDAARERTTAAKAAAVNAKRERDRLQTLVGRLRDQVFDAFCPTCTRPFTGEEAESVVAALAAQVEAADAAEAAERRTARAATEAATAADAAEAEARRRLADVQRIDAALADGRQHIAEQTERVQQTSDERDDALREAGLRKAPDETEVQAAQVEADLLQAV